MGWKGSSKNIFLRTPAPETKFRRKLNPNTFVSVENQP